MLEIDQHVTLETIEHELTQVLARPDAEVVWPSQICGPSLGGESALVQLVATWAARANNPVLILPYQTATTNDVDAFLTNVHGLAATLLTDSARDREGNDRSETVR